MKKDKSLFPTLWKEMKDLAPEVYFRGCEIPPYFHAQSDPRMPIGDIVSTIRAVGNGVNCSGYADEDGIHFHLPDDYTILVDLSKDLVFVSRPGDIEGSIPTAWQILRFLQEPVKRCLFIGSDEAALVEKTERTSELCVALDGLWYSERCTDLQIEVVQSDEARKKGLGKLMKLHEDDCFGFLSEMWEFRGTFGELLMKQSLGLRVLPIRESQELSL